MSQVLFYVRDRVHPVKVVSTQVSVFSTTAMEEDVVRAILIASDPSQGSLHQQALEYLSTIERNAGGTWRLALALFMDITNVGARKHPPQARFFGLRVLDEYFDNR